MVKKTARYVDGFVLPVQKRKIDAYRRLAQKAGKIWKEHGALEFRECVADYMRAKFATPFPRKIKLKRGGDSILFMDNIQVARPS